MNKQQVSSQSVATSAKQTGISSNDVALLAVRVVTGVVLTAHGAQQLLGAFGGGGLTANMSKYGPGGGGLMGLLVAVGLFFGGLGILTGFLTRFSAAANIVIMIGAVVMIHWDKGFFLVDSRFQYLGGYEFNLALIGMCLPLMIAGAGALSIERFIKWPTLPVFKYQRLSLSK